MLPQPGVIINLKIYDRDFCKKKTWHLTCFFCAHVNEVKLKHSGADSIMVDAYCGVITVDDKNKAWCLLLRLTVLIRKIQFIKLLNSTLCRGDPKPSGDLLFSREAM